MKRNLFYIGLILMIIWATSLTSCKKEEEVNEILLPVLSVPEVTEITVQSAWLESRILSDGRGEIIERGFLWSIVENPGLFDNTLNAGMGLGAFTGKISSLTPGTRYFIRAFASNQAGTAFSNSVQIITPQTVTEAGVLTHNPGNITSNSVFAGGTVINNGGGEITERGVCWSTEPSPTIDYFKAVSGNGSGVFTGLITGLQPGKVYFMRAYAINSAGVSYGSEVSFRTPAVRGKKRSDFPGESAFHLLNFSIENKLYIGFGMYDWFSWSGELWEWNQETELWRTLTGYPDDVTGVEQAFTIGGKGYILAFGSMDINGEYVTKLWEYDPASDRWAQKSTHPVKGMRSSSAIFSIGTRAYVGLGQEPDENGTYTVSPTDFWEWDQGTDTWSRKADFPGVGRSSAATFSIGNKGYIGTGVSTGWITDLWEYDQNSDTWNRKAEFPGNPRYLAAGYSIGSKGYFSAGAISAYLNQEETQDLWEWDQATDKWILIGQLNLPNGRYASLAGLVGSHGYYITNPSGNNHRVELWTFPLTADK